MKSCFLPVLLATAAFGLPQPAKKAARLPIVYSRPHRRQNQVIPVVVGGTQLTYVPNSVVAAVGDIVQFQFSNGNHTVTQSSADAPCTPLAGGIHSGGIPFEDGQAEVGTFNLPITSTEPMFLYCATGPHCQLGQVMVINANAQQLTDYMKASQQTTESKDGTEVKGGTMGKISLATAAFVPAPPEDPAEAAPPPPPAAGGNATAPAAENATVPAAEPPAQSSAAAANNVPAVLVGIGL